MLNDWPLDVLQRYLPEIAEPPGLADFWDRTLHETRLMISVRAFELVDTGLTLVDTYDVTFAGYGGQEVRGWLRVPAGTETPLPTVDRLPGIRRRPRTRPRADHLASRRIRAPAHGHAGQGSVWKIGATPDAEPGSNPEQPGFMTRGILSPESYYYRRLITDAVRAVEAAAAHPLVDAARIVVNGGSQGGGSRSRSLRSPSPPSCPRSPG